jgi:amidase
MPGQNTIPSVCGPLATTPGSLKLMIKSILTQKPWLQDPAVVDLPWREELSELSIANGDSLTFGFYSSDGVINPQPPVQRALEMVKTAIRHMGHHIVEWKPPSHAQATQFAVSDTFRVFYETFTEFERSKHLLKMVE